LISSTFIVFSFRAVSGLFFLHFSASGKNSRNGAKGTNGAGGGVAGRKGRRDECQTRFGFVWREIGA
jgi:hypothetical protein